MRLPTPSPNLNVRIATTRRELVEGFELVYSSYLAKGYIQPHPGRIVYQPVFGLPSTRTMVVVTPENDMAGTLSIVGDNPTGFQLESTYPAEVQSLRDDGRKIAEITCLTTESTGGFRPREIFVALTRFTIHYAMWMGYDDLLMAVHPRHYRFYWRLFRVDPLGPPRTHHAVEGNLSLFCRIDLGNLERNMTPELSRLYYSYECPQVQFLRPPISPADHQYCCDRTEASSNIDLDVLPASSREAA